MKGRTLKGGGRSVKGGGQRRVWEVCGWRGQLAAATWAGVRTDAKGFLGVSLVGVCWAGVGWVGVGWVGVACNHALCNGAESGRGVADDAAGAADAGQKREGRQESRQ